MKHCPVVELPKQEKSPPVARHGNEPSRQEARCSIHGIDFGAFFRIAPWRN
jgi:hypothetical protein